jgi:hypothetical protein
MAFGKRTPTRYHGVQRRRAPDSQPLPAPAQIIRAQWRRRLGQTMQHRLASYVRTSAADWVPDPRKPHQFATGPLTDS